MKKFDKFRDIEYKRPDTEELKRYIADFTKKFRQAKSYEEARGLYIAYDRENGHFFTAYHVAYIRYTADTADEFYSGEIEYLDERLPQIELLGKEASAALLESPYAAAFAAEFGEDLIKSAEAQIRLSDESVVDEKVEESKACREYSRTVAACTVEFRGEECNFYGLLKHM